MLSVVRRPVSVYIVILTGKVVFYISIGTVTNFKFTDFEEGKLSRNAVLTVSHSSLAVNFNLIS